MRLLGESPNFYPRPPRGGRQGRRFHVALAQPISIHALREEGDRTLIVFVYCAIGISIHALREEGDNARLNKVVPVCKFLSTPSARRATCLRVVKNLLDVDFYPRPPRGGRRLSVSTALPRRAISIHALREEGDTTGAQTLSPAWHFYPRPPRGGRRSESLRTEKTGYFYPRPPRGGRHPGNHVRLLAFAFLSTPSARRATAVLRLEMQNSARFLSTPSARRATGRPIAFRLP